MIPAALDFGRTLTRVEALCRLGARPPVIRALTGWEGEALVARMFQEINGRRPPRGQLPRDHRQYLATPALRLQASVLAALAGAARHAGLDACEALLAAYRMYVHLFGPRARVGVDRAWHLLQCLQEGRLRQVRCADCGGALVAAAEVDVVAPECPLCVAQRGRALLWFAPVPPRRRRPPAHSALARQVALAEQLCRCGARPPVVADLTRLDNRALIGRLYRECHGRAAPSGLLPSDPRRFVRSRTQRLHASVLAATYERLCAAGAGAAEALLAAHRLYVSVFGERALLDINRGWCLVRSLRIRELRLVGCPHCGTRFVHDSASLVDRHTCPVCGELRRAGGAPSRLRTPSRRPAPPRADGDPLTMAWASH